MTGRVPPRWVTDTDEGHSRWYVERFRRMAAEGVDLGGEARLVDAVVAPRSRILDAGCGPGRVAAHLHDRGHHVVGVDVDPELIAAARADHPGPQWVVADLVDLDLPATGVPGPFDAAVVAGNVLAFVAVGTEGAVLARVAAHLVPGGVALVGFGTDRGYPVESFDRDLVAAGFVLEHRFATWDLEPWRPDAAFAVSILRLPQDPSEGADVTSETTDLTAPAMSYLPEVAALVEVAPEATVSRTVLTAEGVRLVLFSFDAGQELSEHTAAMPVLLQVLDGRLSVSAAGRTEELRPGGVVHLPARLPHAVVALEPARLLLTMLDPRAHG